MKALLIEKRLNGWTARPFATLLGATNLVAEMTVYRTIAELQAALPGLLEAEPNPFAGLPESQQNVGITPKERPESIGYAAAHSEALRARAKSSPAQEAQ